MTTSPTRNIRDIFFDRTPPHLLNCCSVQAIASDPASPILTIYRRLPTDAATWINDAARTRLFDAYLLRHDRDDIWELYSAHGLPLDGGDALQSATSGNPTTPVPVDRAELIQEARELTGDPGLSLIACREDHAGASAADHSNFNIMCRRMIGEATPADLEHVVIIDSRRWPCPVTGVFANVARLSPAMQDVFLDRQKWLQKGWPMVSRDFQEVLADRLARLRADYVCELLRHCGKVARMSEARITAMEAKWLLASPGPKYRFALHIVETLREGLLFEKGMAETFSPEIVRSHGKAVVKDYKGHLTLSRN